MKIARGICKSLPTGCKTFSIIQLGCYAASFLNIMPFCENNKYNNN